MNKLLPSNTASFWIETNEIKSFPKLEKNITAEVCVIGGGISGLTTAYLLKQKGIHVVLVESDKVLSGTTGHTTAKVTVQHNLIYHYLIEAFGIERAVQYYKANNEAFHFIKHMVEKNKINCDYENKSAFVYTNDENYIKELEKELTAYNKLAIEGRIVEKLPISLPSKMGLEIKNQAQFNPVQYLKFLIHDLDNVIYEETPVINVKKENRNVCVKTKDGLHITCDYAVVATHVPFKDKRGLYFAKMHAEKSYAVVGKIKNSFEGMYITAENPSFSLRSINTEVGEMIIFGGESHKTGDTANTASHFNIIKNKAQQFFEVEDFYYHWSTQDLMTIDKVPYIGRLNGASDAILVATGFSKWGMTNGTAAGIILSDYITNNKNDFSEIFSPKRNTTREGIKTFFIQNYDSAKKYVKIRMEDEYRNMFALSKNEGGIVYYHHKKVGAFRDEKDIFHIVKLTCTHLTCGLQWNNAERTWDCPCHGSRFSISGEIVEGPAKKNLEYVVVNGG